MEAKNISPVTIEIQVRFFQAMNELIKKKELEGLKAFCREYGLHKAKYFRLRNAMLVPRETDYKLIDIAALHYMIKDYKISADWLLTGKGSMFK